MRAFFAIFLCIFTSLSAFAAITGGVSKNGSFAKSNQVIDANTGNSIPYAFITIPTKKYQTKTDANGNFKLQTKIDAPTIMSVKKDGYKPYSLTLNEYTNGKPLLVGIEKTSPKDVVVETNMIHLGDNSYSMKSANAGEFSLQAIGAFYSKDFKIKPLTGNENAYLIIGSIIGIDTIMARELGQTKVTTAYANPPQIYCNGNRIAEIKINGDGQEIKIPKHLIQQGAHNEITIKAGKNLTQLAYIDYDDIEFTNLIIEIK